MILSTSDSMVCLPKLSRQLIDSACKDHYSCAYNGGWGQGYRDGPGRRARFRYLQGIAVDKAGNVLVSERFNHRIRQVAPDGTVTTLAGSGKEGCADGHGRVVVPGWHQCGILVVVTSYYGGINVTFSQ